MFTVSFRHTVVCIIEVSWILIGFSANPDPAFYLNADPGSQTIADSGHRN
jgi:hypothetical protein